MSQQEQVDVVATAASPDSGRRREAQDRQQAKPPSRNDRIRLGCIGVGGMGISDSNKAARFGDVVAIRDVNETILDLRDPTSVTAICTGHNGDSYPNASRIAYEFPAITMRPAVTVTLCDGGNLPPADLIPRALLSETGETPSSGALIIGSKGTIYAPGDYGTNARIVDGIHVGDVEFPVSPSHWEEFVRAIRGGEPATSNFSDYSGALAETILLGNLAVWPAADGSGEKIRWDAKSLRVNNVGDVAECVAHLIESADGPGYSP